MRCRESFAVLTKVRISALYIYLKVIDLSRIARIIPTRYRSSTTDTLITFTTYGIKTAILCVRLNFGYCTNIKSFVNYTKMMYV